MYNINKNIGIETGVQYSNKGTQSKFHEVLDINSHYKFKNIYNYDFLDVPLKANFTLGKQKVRFFSSIGIVANFLLKATSQNVAIYPERTVSEVIEYASVSTKYNKFNISPMISLGIDYKINDRMNLRVEPTFKYQALNSIKNSDKRCNFYSGGLNVSYYIGL